MLEKKKYIYIYIYMYIYCALGLIINPLYVIIIPTLKILFSVGSQHFCVDYTRHKVSSPR